MLHRPELEDTALFLYVMALQPNLLSGLDRAIALAWSKAQWCAGCLSDGLLHTVPEHHKKLRCIQQERQQRFQSGPGRQNMPGSEAIVQPQRRAYRQLQLLFRHQSTGAEKPKRPPYQQRGRDQANPNPVTSFGFILLLHSDPTISTRPEFQPTVPMPPIWRPPPSVASPNSKTSY